MADKRPEARGVQREVKLQALEAELRGLEVCLQELEGRLPERHRAAAGLELRLQERRSALAELELHHQELEPCLLKRCGALAELEERLQVRRSAVATLEVRLPPRGMRQARAWDALTTGGRSARPTGRMWQQSANYDLTAGARYTVEPLSR